MHFNVYDKISKYLKYIIIISQYTHTHVYIYIYIHILYYCVHTQTIMIYVYVRINMYCSFCQETQPSVCTNAMIIIIIIITVQYDVLALVVFHCVISTSLQCADTVESTSTSRLAALFSYVRIEKKKKNRTQTLCQYISKSSPLTRLMSQTTLWQNGVWLLRLRQNALILTMTHNDLLE